MEDFPVPCSPHNFTFHTSYKFKHIDYLLDKANAIKTNYISIQQNIDNLDYDDQTKKSAIDRKTTKLLNTEIIAKE